VESMQALMLSVLGGAEIQNEALGTLESYMSISFEKFILDEEMFSRLQRIHQGLDTSGMDERIALIKEVAHGGSYLTHPSTFKAFRDSWQPRVSDWNDYDTWVRAGGKDALKRAGDILTNRLAGEAAICIDDHTDKALREYMEKATSGN
ncbi:MAG: trimethylamine methyltransferase family protein, partial [Desulfobacterales bacterium]|nr:trimethylamine methyltransferase family protein [Desulfobacterales bacterium]